MTQSASTFTASSQRQISAQRSSPQRYRVSMFRYSETLPVWFWECWYCLCCCGACCCCASGCWMYPTVLCCGTLVVCKNAGVDPPCTSPWVICRHNKEYEYSTISRQNTFYQVLFIDVMFDWCAVQTVYTWGLSLNIKTCSAVGRGLYKMGFGR